MKPCVTGKKMYPSEEIAEYALIEARTQFEYKENQGPIGVYLCDDCGKIKLQKEANQWLGKLKKR